jgi:hypothetical protein
MNITLALYQMNRVGTMERLSHDRWPFGRDLNLAPVSMLGMLLTSTVFSNSVRSMPMQASVT